MFRDHGLAIFKDTKLHVLSAATPIGFVYFRDPSQLELGANFAKKRNWRREGDSNPRYGLKPYNGLANRRLQPLGHPSIKQTKNIYSALLPLSMRRARQNPSSHGINSHKSEGGSPFDTIEVHAQPRIRSDKLRKATAGSSALPGIQRIICFGGIYSACSSKKAGKKNKLLHSY